MGRRVIAVLAAVLMLMSPVVPARADLDGVITTRVAIPTRDGLTLDAWLNVPEKPGPHPIVLYPNAWWGDPKQSQMPAVKMARRGYLTVAYVQRGFGKSGGELDVGGPATIGDVSSIIDWLAAEHDGDASRVGAVGLSYSAGVVLLAAAAEPRIKAVVALSTWSDLVKGFFPNQTRYELAVWGLYRAALRHGRPDAEMQEFYADFKAGRNRDRLTEYVRRRSPINQVDALNRNGTAVMMAQEWSDLAYGADQVVDLYNALRGPKRLELRPGDHASQSIASVFGLDSELGTNVQRWLEAHVNGVDNGIKGEAPISLRPRGSDGAMPQETYSDWSQVVGRSRYYSLGAQQPTGRLTPTTAHGRALPWSKQITHANNLFLSRGTAYVLSHYREAFNGGPPRGNLALADRRHSMVWRGAPLAAPMKLRGRARFRLTVTPSAAQGTIVGYLVDIDDAAPGKARLIHEIPYTWLDATPGRPLTLNVPFPDMAYDLAEGHRLGLVVTTHDLLFRSENASRAPIVLGSIVGQSAMLEIPAR